MNDMLSEMINKRLIRRGLTGNFIKLRYANDCVYRNIMGTSNNILYVGIGHGLDAILALSYKNISKITGIDPYISEHGNDDEDYESLLNLISELGLEEKIHLKRHTIQEWITNKPIHENYDVIICNDVLHHIFWTKDYLTKSKYSTDAINLFKSLSEACAEDGILIISEPERHGLRQTLTKLGVLKSCVNYSTKQPRNEWIKVAEGGGWKLVNETNYVPWALRAYSLVFSGLIGRYTACDKYILTFSHN